MPVLSTTRIADRVDHVAPSATTPTQVLMIQCRLRELMAAKGRQERRRITYEDIWTTTGIAQNTLSRLANDRGDRVAMATMERLCAYFDCQPGDLFVYVSDR